MKFDVIIGNPPYQLSVGNLSGNSSKARAIYHGFVTQAMKLNPRFLSMIIPSRWMTRSTEGIPDEWVDLMLLDDRFRVFHDYLDASDVFPGVEIKGGVCFFLWDRDYSGKCAYYSHGVGNQEPLLNVDYLNSKKAGIVIRDMKSLTILDKIEKVEGQYFTDEKNTFISLVSPKDYFTNKVLLTSSWKGYSTTRDNLHSVKYYLNKNIHKCAFG